MRTATATPVKRCFIIADTPEHEQYTRNMVTGASTADLSIIMVGAGKGLQTQSRRHALIASLQGIPHVVPDVNKLDLVDYAQDVFDLICAEFVDFCMQLRFAELDFIPSSALKGNMIVDRGERPDWHHGRTLLELLETSNGGERRQTTMRFPVQSVGRTKMGLRGDYRGHFERIEAGRVTVGDV